MRLKKSISKLMRVRKRKEVARKARSAKPPLLARILSLKAKICRLTSSVYSKKPLQNTVSLRKPSVWSTKSSLTSMMISWKSRDNWCSFRKSRLLAAKNANHLSNFLFLVNLASRLCWKAEKLSRTTLALIDFWFDLNFERIISKWNELYLILITFFKITYNAAKNEYIDKREFLIF